MLSLFNIHPRVVLWIEQFIFNILQMIKFDLFSGSSFAQKSSTFFAGGLIHAETWEEKTPTQKFRFQSKFREKSGSSKIRLLIQRGREPARPSYGRCFESRLHSGRFPALTNPAGCKEWSRSPWSWGSQYTLTINISQCMPKQRASKLENKKPKYKTFFMFWSVCLWRSAEVRKEASSIPAPIHFERSEFVDKRKSDSERTSSTAIAWPSGIGAEDCSGNLKISRFGGTSPTFFGFRVSVPSLKPEWSGGFLIIRSVAFTLRCSKLKLQDLFNIMTCIFHFDFLSKLVIFDALNKRR